MINKFKELQELEHLRKLNFSNLSEKELKFIKEKNLLVFKEGEFEFNSNLSLDKETYQDCLKYFKLVISARLDQNLENLRLKGYRIRKNKLSFDDFKFHNKIIPEFKSDCLILNLDQSASNNYHMAFYDTPLTE